MRLSTLLSIILTKTPLSVSIPEGDDLDLESPDRLLVFPVHHKISGVVAEACRAVGLSERAAYGFGKFVAKLMTGWSSRYSNENDVMMLDTVFGQAAYGNPSTVIRLYMLPNWEALGEHIEVVQRGVAAAFEKAKSL